MIQLSVVLTSFARKLVLREFRRNSSIRSEFRLPMFIRSSFVANTICVHSSIKDSCGTMCHKKRGRSDVKAQRRTRQHARTRFIAATVSYCRAKRGVAIAVCIQNRSWHKGPEFLWVIRCALRVVGLHGTSRHQRSIPTFLRNSGVQTQHFPTPQA
jgi:hypothetical protein